MGDYEVTNDQKLDAIKDNFKPPTMGLIGRDEAIELLNRLGADPSDFFNYVYKHGEYILEDKKKFYWIKELTTFLKKVLEIKQKDE